MGESGLGRTTLGRLMVGLLAPDSGSILFDGAPAATRGIALKRHRKDVQRMFQDPYAPPPTRRRAAASARAVRAPRRSARWRSRLSGPSGISGTSRRATSRLSTPACRPPSARRWRDRQGCRVAGRASWGPERADDDHPDSFVTRGSTPVSGR
ncbi:MAG: ATP-binding cassette domain-containing protein [Actinomycetota bacterium]|nr:ATP-binding cassette domain-containing protein [Actinomycetota bacterium]